MTDWLGSCTASIAVTCITLTGTVGFVNPRTTEEGCGGMTGMAIQCGFKVGRVDLGILTDRCNTMARRTIIYDTGMIKYRTDESTGVMTNATILIGKNMGVCFADGETSTMT
jgi:hypothetical protein